MRFNLSKEALARVNGLTCTGCDGKYPVDVQYGPCLNCGGQLLLNLVLGDISKKVNRRTFAKREWSTWRYRELLPDINEEKVVSLGEGGTALLECKRLARALGLQKLLIKDETTNPTGSFLDRGMTVDISRANELGFRSVSCRADSGNFAASASAYAARAGFKCTVILLKERIEAVNVGKLYQIIAYGGNLVVENQPTDNPDATGAMDRPYVLSPSNSYFAEGEKTIVYEICEQLEWQTPDRIIVPMGQGEHLSMIWRGISELRQLGLINEQKVSMMGVQLESYAEIVDRLHGRKAARAPRDAQKTVAVELATKKPSHANLAIDAIRASRGEGVKVKDTDVLDAMALLARTEGIFAEPAAASTIAGLKRLIEQGAVSRDETIVCVITGAGLKDPYTARRFITKVKQVDRILSQIESRSYTTRLGTTKLAMLRVIAGKETYGYEIWRGLQKLGLELDISSVYQHLSELEKIGLILKSRTASVLGKPKRTYYRTTDQGRSLITATNSQK
jgi:threonine synthase